MQWGLIGNVCKLSSTDLQAFGPDVQVWTGGFRPIGIFGMSHEQLLQSEWVTDDTLTIRFEIEVHPFDAEPTELSLSCGPSISPPTIAADFLSLFNQGKYTDVTFIVQGERIKAHKLVLCARSEVFDRMFNAGMSESVSREIAIEDCDSTSFTVLLKFLYTDDLNSVEEALEDPASSSTEGSSGGSTGSTAATSGFDAMRVLQAVLTVSHKYEVSRLNSWCEQQMCKHITTSNVCDVLCQAHLYDAKRLEAACLAVIGEKRQEVMGSEAFAQLCQRPEVLLRLSRHLGGVPELPTSSGSSSVVPVAAPAAAQQREAPGKRKHEDTAAF